MNLGAHISIAGGIDKIFSRANKVTANVIQIFTRNNNRWTGKEYTSELIASYFQKKKEAGNPLVFAHSSYLINLCSPKEEVRDKSIPALRDELSRCDILEIPYLVMHPGSHLGEGLSVGIDNFVKTLKRVFAGFETNTQILLETTAGQGSSVGHALEEIAEIIDRTKNIHNFGVCLDTCHLFAAGYNLRSEKDVLRFKSKLSQVIGLEKVKAVHLNDSMKDLNSRVDRHEHIGRGKIGEKGFKYFLREFSHLPMVLETPKDRDGIGDKENLALLRDLFNI